MKTENQSVPYKVAGCRIIGYKMSPVATAVTLSCQMKK